ncbi:uncharacterized protein L203_104126 [Cryptococcus depauperatus CBS 7841]|uniref:Uncharacterized protein n=1 Tax=Cryptococcus depauperatus CBS 7841 TaxID=1295531 RepID=A0AAJ8JUV4_9TREE
MANDSVASNLQKVMDLHDRITSQVRKNEEMSQRCQPPSLSILSGRQQDDGWTAWKEDKHNRYKEYLASRIFGLKVDTELGKKISLVPKITQRGEDSVLNLTYCIPNSVVSKNQDRQQWLGNLAQEQKDEMTLNGCSSHGMHSPTPQTTAGHLVASLTRSKNPQIDGYDDAKEAFIRDGERYSWRDLERAYKAVPKRYPLYSIAESAPPVFEEKASIRISHKPGDLASSLAWAEECGETCESELAERQRRFPGRPGAASYSDSGVNQAAEYEKQSEADRKLVERRARELFTNDPNRKFKETDFSSVFAPAPTHARLYSNVNDGFREDNIVNGKIRYCLTDDGGGSVYPPSDYLASLLTAAPTNG